MREREDGRFARRELTQTPVRDAAQEVQRLEAQLEEARRKLAILRDPWAGLEDGQCRTYIKGGRTFANAIINCCGTGPVRLILEVVK